MNYLSKYDPYAIQQIQFNTQKRTKFTTLKSVCISIIIIILTFLINWSIIQNIWIPRSKLQINENQQKTNTQLSTNFLCIVSQTLGVQAPYSNLVSIQRQSKQIISPQILKDVTVPNQLTAEMLHEINGKDYYCYNLKGLEVNKFKAIQLKVFGPADVLVKTYSVAEFLQEQMARYYYHHSTQDGIQMILIMNKIKGVIYDKLWANYQPQIILGFQNGKVKYQVSSNNNNVNTQQNVNTYYFTSQTLPDNQLTRQIVIQRKNIGQIIGKFFSWFTVFVLLFTFLIKPIVQQSFKLTLSQLIYNNNNLNQIQTSILSFIKYILSIFIKGQFNQEIIHTAYNKLDKDLDIINLIKRQVLMKKLIKQNQILGKLARQDHESADNVDSVFQYNIQNKSDSLFIRNKKLNYDQQSNKQQYVDITEKMNKSSCSKTISFNIESDPQKNRKCFLIDLITSMDIGQTSINLLSNKGMGYRNGWNSIISVLFGVIVFIFLIIAGFLTISSEYRLKSILEGRQSIHYIDISPNDMIFRAKKSPGDTWQFQIQILDDQYKFVQNVVTISGSACNQYVIGLGQDNSQNNWQCLPSPLRLLNDGKGNKRILFMRLFSPNPFLLITKPIEIVFKQTTFSNNFSSEIQRLSIMPSNSINYIPLQILNNDKQNQYVWTSYQRRTFLGALKGIVFQLKQEILKIQKQDNTIWDVIDKSWGVFIICFTLILSKVSHYLNVREREKIMTNKENQSRNDIVEIVKIQYLLENKVFKKELEAVGGYFKQALSRDIV